MSRDQATENFEDGMKALFNVPKDEVCEGREEGAEEACFSEVFPALTSCFRQGLEGDLFRFPRPCRYVARRFVFTCEVGVSEAATSNLAHRQLESLNVRIGDLSARLRLL